SHLVLVGKSGAQGVTNWTDWSWRRRPSIARGRFAACELFQQSARVSDCDFGRHLHQSPRHVGITAEEILQFWAGFVLHDELLHPLPDGHVAKSNGVKISIALARFGESCVVGLVNGSLLLEKFTDAADLH